MEDERSSLAMDTLLIAGYQKLPVHRTQIRTKRTKRWFCHAEESSDAHRWTLIDCDETRIGKRVSRGGCRLLDPLAVLMPVGPDGFELAVLVSARSLLLAVLMPEGPVSCLDT